MTTLTSLKSTLGLLVQSISERTDPETYCSGGCGALTMALWLYIEKNHGHLLPQCRILVLYRVEKCDDTDDELDRVISHIMLQVEADTLDIYGWGADERWCQRIDDIEPWNDDAHNDVEYEELSCASALPKTAEPYSMNLTPDKIAMDVLGLKTAVNAAA